MVDLNGDGELDLVVLNQGLGGANDNLRVFGGHVGYSVRPSARGNGIATELLRHAIDHLRGRGVAAFLITCDPLNVASARVIEKCGGVLHDQSYSAEHGHEICRYWID